MKKVSVFLLLVCPIFLFGQKDRLESNIEEIVIQENRLITPFKESSRSIQIIDRNQIEQAAAKDIAELLQLVAGVDVRQRGVHGVQSDIGIRGGTFEQTLILVNGIKLIDPQTGHHNMNVPVNINVIERIEILKGPAARIYGQNGFSGAINIVTKRPDKNELSFGVQYGEHNTLGLSITENIITENSSHLLSLNRNTSDGYRFNTDYKVENILYQGNIKTGKNDLTLSIGHSWRNFGANGFYASPDFMDQYEEVTTTLASLQYKFEAGGWFVTPRVSYRKNQDDYVFVRDNPAIYQNIHQSDNLLLELNARKINKWGTLGVGGEFNKILMESTNLGDRDREVYSLFVEQRFHLLDDKLDITPGVSFSAYSDFDNRFFPGIDIGYTMSSEWKAFFNYGITYRVPSYTDRFYQDPVNLGNPDLEPEEAATYELGTTYSKNGLLVQASYFYRDGTDLIDWVREADTLQWQPVNIGKIQTHGFDLNGSYRFAEELPLDYINVGYAKIMVDQDEVNAPFSRYALEHLNNQLTAGLQWSVQNFKHSVHFRYLDRENLEDYSIVDTKLRYLTEWGELNFTINNVFDVAYRETNLVDMPGRWIYGGVRYDLKY